MKKRITSAWLRVKSLLEKEPLPREGNERCERRLEVIDCPLRFKYGLLLKRSGHGEIRDISIHGIKFETFSRVRKGGKLRLILTMPHGFPGAKQLTLAARVAYIGQPKGVKYYGVGCRLEHPTEYTKELLRQYRWMVETLA